MGHYLLLFYSLLVGILIFAAVYYVFKRTRYRVIRRQLLQPPGGTRIFHFAAQFHGIPWNRPATTRTPNQMEFIFEPSDMTYYREQQTRWVPNYFDFDFDDDTLDIYDPDSQNVHDTLVQRAVRQKYHEEVKDRPIEPEGPDNVIHLLKQEANKLPIHRRNNVIQVLKTISNRKTPIYNLDGKTEKEILAQVWSSLQPGESEELLKQLEDCIEDTNVVCTTGVATRLMSTLFLKDPEATPRKKEHVREEMLGKAAKLRGEYASETSRGFLARLHSVFSKDYDGILTQDEIEKELDSWGADF